MNPYDEDENPGADAESPVAQAWATGPQLTVVGPQVYERRGGQGDLRRVDPAYIEIVRDQALDCRPQCQDKDVEREGECACRDVPIAFRPRKPPSPPQNTGAQM